MLSDWFLRWFKPIADWILAQAKNEFPYEDFVVIEQRRNHLYGNRTRV